MPIYEYICKECNQKHEALQKISDESLTVCPKCGGELEKIVSLGSFALKGSGWYKSDYADKPACKTCSTQGCCSND